MKLVAQLWDIETGQVIRPLAGRTPAEFSIVGFSTTTNRVLSN
jgi:hypothetical protein